MGRDIRYVCTSCRQITGLFGGHAVNEVGRKSCDGCGSNKDDLQTVSEAAFDKAVKEYHTKTDAAAS